MKVAIENLGTEVRVRIDDVIGEEQSLLERIRQCRQSAWACPSAECYNIGSIREQVGTGGVQLILTPRTGVQLDPAGIAHCLHYMLRTPIKA